MPLADYTKTLAPVVADLLEPGERLLAAARGMSKGATKGIVGGVAGAVGLGAAGLAVGTSVGAEERAEGQEEQRQAGLTRLPAQIVLGLTDRRLLFFARSGLSGKAGDLVGGIPESASAPSTPTRPRARSSPTCSP